MIFLDTNVIIRYLTRSPDPLVQAMERQALHLFEFVERGEETVTTSEVVLHEVAYVLMSKRHYGVDRLTVASYLRALLRLRGLHLPTGERKVYSRAIELFGSHSGLSMADCLVAARSERMGIPLATFDGPLGNLPVIDRWTFPN